ncbi:MAG: hypothetical protein IIZ25_00555 [Thermoguttaceae bacterium]|nr:hypothetical protein [Thermoguttaceae bacterium]
MTQEKKKRRAEVILTGEFLEQVPFSVQDIAGRVCDHCSGQGAVLHRCRALLQTDKFSFAKELFEAGFEVIPSENEASDLAVCALLSALGNNPPDELILGAGSRLSGQLLTALENRVLRTIIAAEPADIHQKADYVLDLTVGTLDSLSDEETGGAPVMDEAEEQRLRAEEARRTEAARLARLITTEGWAEELTEIVKNHNLSFPVLRAIDELRPKFPEQADLFRDRREILRKNLPDDLRWVDENHSGTTIPMLYHRDAPVVQPVPATEAIGLINFGSARSEPPAKQADPPTNYRSQEVSFADIAVRADILADACRWQCDRLELERTGADYREHIRPKDEELKQRGKLHNVFIWMFRQDFRFNDAQWRDMALAYDLLSRTARLMNDILQAKASRPLPERAAQLMADAICIVKTQLFNRGLDLSIDYVQCSAYELVKNYAIEAQTFLRHLKMDERLETSESERILEKVAEYQEMLQLFSTTKKSIEELFKSLAYHAKKIAESPNPGLEEDHWKKTIELVTQMCDEYRLPTSNPKLREILSDILPNIPEDADTTGTFLNVVQQIDIFDEEMAESYLPEPKKLQEPSPAVKLVRSYIGGSKIVWIGGTPVDHLRSRIEDRFEAELIWEAHDHGDSLGRFTSVLNDPEVKLFLIYIPWCSHKHSEEFTQIIRSSGKDFVRLRKGTNPEQIASAICQQLNLS